MPRSTLRIFSVFSTFLLAALCASPARSAVINYSMQALGGNTYRNTYKVSAEFGEAPIREFTIFFYVDEFSNLAAGAAPPGWDVLAIQPDPSITGAGFFDALALGGGIVYGAPQGGFSITYSAPFPSRSQPFDVVDPASFVTISSGATTTIPAVPEPGRLPMLLLGMAGLLLLRRHANRSVPTLPQGERDGSLFH
jgi:hypothetical protein